MQATSDGDRDDITRAHIVFVNPSVAAISARRSRCLGRSTIDCAGRGVGYRLGELDEVVLADATTIYKSPGSEYTPFVIPVLTQHYTSLQRSLLYTGMTRGKRLVVWVDQRKAVGIAVRGIQGRRRWSKLKELLVMDVAKFVTREPAVQSRRGPCYRHGPR